jgi:hypothetical protein
MKALTLLSLSSLLLAAGCGEGNPDGRVGVSGRISFQGKPLSNGRIVFAPAKGTPGLAAGGKVEAGRFQIDADDGPTAGEYQVTVTIGVLRKDPKIGSDPDDKSQLIPPVEQTFEVTHIIVSDRDNILDLELPPRKDD